MRFERVIATAGPDGRVRFEITGHPGRVYEVEVSVVEEPATGDPPQTSGPESRGWPPGFLERMAGSIPDPTFERGDQT